MPIKNRNKIALAAGILTLAFIFHSQTLPASRHESQDLRFQTFFADALEPSGLDERDSQNRPISSSHSLTPKLREIFTASVIQNLTSRELAPVSGHRNILKDITKPIRQFLARARRWLVRAFELAV